MSEHNFCLNAGSTVSWPVSFLAVPSRKQRQRDPVNCWCCGSKDATHESVYSWTNAWGVAAPPGVTICTPVSTYYRKGAIMKRITRLVNVSTLFALLPAALLAQDEQRTLTGLAG